MRNHELWEFIQHLSGFTSEDLHFFKIDFLKDLPAIWFCPLF